MKLVIFIFVFLFLAMLVLVLLATAGQAPEINLTWQNNSKELTATEIYRSEGTLPAQMIGSVNRNTERYTDKTVVPGVLYCYYVVSTKDGKERSNASNTVCSNVLFR